MGGEKEEKKITPPSPKKKEDWQKAYENVVQVAKPAANGKKPGKSRSQERAEKSYAVIQRANVMIEKIKKLNEMSKDNSKAPTVDKGKTNEALNVAKAKAEETAAKEKADAALEQAK